MDADHAAKAATARLDAFVDAAFAFAVTLLVIGGSQPPQTMDDFVAALARVPAFAASFALIARFWLGHRRFAATAPVRGKLSTILSLAIVFVILIYVYPLRMLMEAGAAYLSGGRLPGRNPVDSWSDLANLYGVYGVGFAILAGLYAALYVEALRSARGSAPAEVRDDLLDWAVSWGIVAASGVLSALLGWFGPLRQAPWLPGFIYFAIPAGIGAWAWLRSRGAKTRTASETPD